MRVLIVNNFSYVTGGADRYCFDLARLLRGAGHEVEFLSTASASNVELSGAFVPLEITNATRDGLPYMGRAGVALRAFWHRGVANATEKLIATFKPDVVHAHKIYPHLSIAPILVARAHGIPIVQTLHDYEFVSANAVDHTGRRTDRDEARLEYRVLNTALFAFKRRFHVPAVDSWIAISRFVAATYARHGIAAHVVPNATLTGGGHVPAFAEREGVLYAGRLTAAKGITHVVKVARALPDMMIRIAGTGPLAEHVIAAAAELPNLHYLGVLSQEAVQTQLRQSRVCLTPSTWQEPAGLGALEAMAAGTPQVVSAVGGLAEYVRDAEAGIIVGTDPALFVESCARLVASRDLWEKLSANALAAVRDTHSPASFLQRTVQVYEALIAPRRPS